MTDTNKASIPSTRVYIKPLAWEKQWRLVHSIDAEVAWFGFCTIAPESHLIIVDDIVVPQQTVTKDEVEYGPDYLHEIMEKYPDDIGRLRFFGHSHNDHAVSFSPTDVHEMIEPLAALEMDYFISHVVNNKGEHLTRLDQVTPYKVSLEVDLVKAIPEGVMDWVNDSLESQVEIKKEEKKTQSTTTSGSSYSSGTSAAAGSGTGHSWSKDPEFTDEEIKAAHLKVVYDSNEARRHPKAVVHMLNAVKPRRNYYEGGKFQSGVELTATAARDDWEEHRKGVVAEMEAVKKRAEENKKKDDEKSDGKSSTESRSVKRSEEKRAEGKAQAPPEVGKEESQERQHLIPIVSGAKSELLKSERLKLRRNPETDLRVRRSPLLDVIEGECDDLDEQDIILEAHGFDEWDDVITDTLEEEEEMELGTLLTLTGFTIENLARWGYLRDARTGELIPATEM